MQERLGVRESIEPWARKVVRGELPAEHRAFYAALPYLVAAARDEEGRPWATLLTGDPGFASSPDPGALAVAASPRRGDALDGAFRAGADLGLLGIELHTRRRNRVNGRVRSGDAKGFVLDVEQSFGNCPQHIHERSWRRDASAASVPRRWAGDSLSGPALGLVERADTFFIATGHRGDGESPAFGLDASHRGGPPGFVRACGPRSLSFPDYAGNNHFNTLGNLELDARAGLLFVDFERGDLLQLTGRAVVDWDAPEASSIPGARRMVRFEIESVVLLHQALPLRFDAEGDAQRELTLVAKRRESDDVSSFYFRPRDGSAISPFAAGQHLPVSVSLPGSSETAARSYSLSNDAREGVYRVTVKRETLGLVSRSLHDSLEIGDCIRAGDPSGDFTLREGEDRPVVLVSAGVGVTPMVAMLRELVARRSGVPVLFVHGARDGAHHPLASEVRSLAAEAREATVHVSYSRPLPGDLASGAGDVVRAGRVDSALLEALVPALDAEFYLCGPTGFMAALQDGLETKGVALSRIHTESFGA